MYYNFSSAHLHMYLTVQNEFEKFYYYIKYEVPMKIFYAKEQNALIIVNMFRSVIKVSQVNDILFMIILDVYI